MVSGFSEDAVSWLLDARGIAGLGTECADIELPWKTKQAVKQMLAAANRYSVVQVSPSVDNFQRMVVCSQLLWSQNIDHQILVTSEFSNLATSVFG
jgi:hypothetical protein